MQEWCKTKMMNRFIICSLFLFLFCNLVNADSYWDYLTKPRADTLYCGIGLGCNANGTINSSSVVHNSLAALQGGQTNQYYHLNQSLFERLRDYAYVWLTVDDDSMYATSAYVNNTFITKIEANNTFIQLGNLSSNDVDAICSTDGKILKRLGGVWACAEDAVGSTGTFLNYTKSVNMNPTTGNKEVSLSFYVP